MRGLGTLAALLLGVQLARLLRPDGLGQYGIALALAQILGAVAQAGFATLAVREIATSLQARDWSLLRGVIYWFARIILILSVIVGSLFLAGLWLYAELAGKPLPSSLAYAAPLIPLFALVILLNAEIRALGGIVKGQSLEILVRPLLLCVMVFIAFLVAGTLTIELALIIQGIASLLTIALGVIWRRAALPAEARSARPLARPAVWRRAAVPLAASDILQQLTGLYGLLVLGLLASASEAGYFRVALSTVVFVATPVSVVNVVLAPRLAQLHAAGKTSDIQSLLIGAAAVMSAFTVASLAALHLVGQRLLEAFFGPAYGHAWAPLMLLTAAQVIISLFGVGWVHLSVTGGERKLTRAFLISTPAGIGTAFLLVPSMGAVGAGWAAVVGAIVLNLMCWYYLRASGLESSLFGLLSRRGTVSPFHLFREARLPAVAPDIKAQQPVND